MQFRVREITPEDMREIVSWHYPEPYSGYDIHPDALDDPLSFEGYYSVVDEAGALAGYFCYGEDAQVPPGGQLGFYGPEAVDVGLGMRPDLAGQGLGAVFVRAGLDFGHERLGIERFRLSVQSWNERAIKVYERVGFREVGSFGQVTGDGTMEYVVMVLEPVWVD